MAVKYKNEIVSDKKLREILKKEKEIAKKVVKTKENIKIFYI